MKKVLLILLGICSFSALATKYDDTVEPKMPSDYVTQDRFVSTAMRGTMDLIITDTKTGCQYFVVDAGGYSKPATSLGCFEEYKKK
ncbi:hypothetical protein pETSU_208 [Edwardsiella phage pEt-SU]|uniref:Uncharacterized protein n=1 Tax=Edwardsiella phage pEt-SU TaxID=2562142 RepID=A0A4D6DYQ1_9CAUD|nr:hypothetical protein HOV39_gp208 [Edwardsiella phage pEt-SU]QBZ70789.1 hypothetical protein pETSU_208 [Edwardsiella phage pEt-SU]